MVTVCGALVLLIVGAWIALGRSSRERIRGAGPAEPAPEGRGVIGTVAGLEARAERTDTTGIEDGGLASGAAAERLSTPAGLRVEVADADSGDPIDSAQVNVLSSPEAGRWEWERAAKQTDTDGVAMLGPFPAGTQRSVRVQVTLTIDRHPPAPADDPEGLPPFPPVWWPDSREVFVLLNAEGSETRLRLTFQRLGPIRGRVRLPDGSAGAGARMGMSERGSSPGHQTADSEGRFDYQPERGEAHHLYASLSRDGVHYRGAATALPGQVDVVIDLVPRSRDILIEGRDAEGHLLEDLGVYLRTARGAGGSGHFRGGRTWLDVGIGTEDETDRWLLVGNERVLGWHGPLAPRQERVLVRLGTGHAIEGVVRDPNGVRVEAARVHARAQEVPGVAGGGVPYQSATSDEQGRFRLEGLPDLLYDVHAEAHPPLRASPAVSVRAGTSDLVLVLQAGRGVVIRVLRADGKPAQNTRVTLEGREERETESQHAETDAEGVARIDRLDPQALYDLRIAPPSTASGREHSREAWRPEDITVQLEAAHAVTGRVVDPAGRPVPYATVKGWGEGHVVHSMADAEGRFELDGFSEGRVAVAVLDGNGPQSPAHERAPASAHPVDAGSSVTLTIVPGRELAVLVPNWHSDASRWRAVLLEGDPASPSRSISPYWARDAFLFRTLRPEASYTLWMHDERDLCAWIPGVRPGGDLTVRLERGALLSGAVVLPNPVARWDASVTIAGVRVKADREANVGRYVLRGLPPGTHVVHGTAWLRDGRTLRTRITAPAGSTSADLVRWE
jgi:hypothetical protein